MEEKIIQALQKTNWKLDKAPNGLYHTQYQGKNTKLIIHLNILNLDESVLFAIAYLPIKVERHQINKVARFLNELNLDRFFGSFELDYTIGEIAFRTGIYYFNTDFQMPMAFNCLDAAAYFADMNYPSILEVINN